MTFDSERVLDEVGWQILAELQENARISYTELGRRIGLTAPAVAERIHRLEEAGIIRGYRAELNLEGVGRGTVAFIRLATDQITCPRFGAIVAREFPEVLECHRITGGDSYVVKVAVPSVRELESLIDRLMPYGQTVTSIVLSSPVTNRVIGPHEADIEAGRAEVRVGAAGQ
jgi:Lrp/AsnC family leucine-responsive transcriptional regulator